MDERLKKQLDFALEIDKEKKYSPPDSFIRSRKKWKWRRTCVAYGDHGLSFTGVFQWACWYYQSHAYVSDPWCSGDRRRGYLCLWWRRQEDPEGKEEAAKERIYSLLPEDQKEELAAIFDEFEESKTPESKFAHAMDNLQPLMLNNSNDGGDWREHGVSAKQVYGRQSRTKEGSEKLYEVTDQIIKKHREKGNLKWN